MAQTSDCNQCTPEAVKIHMTEEMEILELMAFQSSACRRRWKKLLKKKANKVPDVEKNNLLSDLEIASFALADDMMIHKDQSRPGPGKEDSDEGKDQMKSLAKMAKQLHIERSPEKTVKSGKIGKKDKKRPRVPSCNF